jgi:Xaa-Pro aminopeptidase
MPAEGVDLIAIAPTANMRYLLGFAPLMDERSCLLLIGPADIRLVVPTLNADQVESRTGMRAMRWNDAEGPHAALATALIELGLRSAATLAVDDSMRADTLLLLQEAARPGTCLPAGSLMAPLRMRKSDAELAALARAARLADEALLAGVEACTPGVSERKVAEAVAARFRAGGAELIDFTIIASGPNGAFPHHETGERRLAAGDAIILDIGATLEGYKSDLTRMVSLGPPSEELLAAYQAVLEANRLGRAAARPGSRAKEVDRAARSHLEKTGYGPYFVHRTGHGLGLEAHEPPWITSESDTVLEPGMVFSVEPGVYLPGKFGIRVEDIVAVTEDGPRVLTGLDHELIVRT